MREGEGEKEIERKRDNTMLVNLDLLNWYLLRHLSSKTPIYCDKKRCSYTNIFTSQTLDFVIQSKDKFYIQEI